MSPDEALVAVAARLRHHRIPFALVGGLAVSIRGEVRFTRDVDLAVAAFPRAPRHCLGRPREAPATNR